MSRAALYPEHERVSCSDADPCNAAAKDGCGRCTALALDAADQRWVPCSERLPELPAVAPLARDRVTCACHTRDGQVIAMEWARNPWAKTEAGRAPRWEWNGRLSPWAVLDWQPLPAPPHR